MRPERKAERATAVAWALTDLRTIERFEAMFDVRDGDACWPARGGTSGEGYIAFRVDRSRNINVQAHRFAYQLYVGPIPDGLVVDHACHNRDLSCPGGDTCPHRRCVNPAHLEPVTQRENIRRSSLTNGHKTHCAQGHPYDEENTFFRKNGKRVCRACKSASGRRWHEKDRQERSAGRRDSQACPQGHLFTEENTYRHTDGKRRCRECRTARGRDRRAAEKTLKSSTKNGEAYPGNQNSITDPGEATAPLAGALARRTDKGPFNA